LQSSVKQGGILTLPTGRQATELPNQFFKAIANVIDSFEITTSINKKNEKILLKNCVN
jgi:hypothetical protein